MANFKMIIVTILFSIGLTGCSMLETVNSITPEDSQLNREGAQAQMEEKMRQALYAGEKITEFTAVITYPDTETKTPTHYQFTMRVNNKIKQYEFDNK